MPRKSKKSKTTITRNAQLHPQEDQLSSLPDALLVEILSLLPIKSAVSTTILSQRWHNLWTHINHRHFQGGSTFYTTVDHFLSQLTSPSLRTFTLHLTSSNNFPSLVVASWIRNICSRNVEIIKFLTLKAQCSTRIEVVGLREKRRCIFGFIIIECKLHMEINRLLLNWREQGN